MPDYQIDWVLNDSDYIPAHRYECAYCNSAVASQIGIHGKAMLPIGRTLPIERICICPLCGRPTYIPAMGPQVPAPLPCKPVAHLPPDVQTLFTEARRAVSAGANTAAVMLCRTILMHLAVEQKAPPKTERGKSLTFQYYVDYLVAQNLVPVGAKPWVDKIRELGNEAVHDLAVMSSGDAKLILEFTTLLLQILYETHGEMQRRFGAP